MYKYNDLIDKTVLVTGASGDLGLAICTRFLEQQCRVYALYNSHAADLIELKKIHPHGEQLNILQCDLANNESVIQLCAYLSESAGKIDVLVNNAGIVKDSLFAAMSVDDFSTVIDTNLLTVFRLTKEALMLLRAAESPVIVNVASIAAIIPSVGQINYSASKGAMLSFTRTLAAELAPRGVRVNAVAPGMIDSKMVKKVSRTVVRDVINSIPLKRLGKSAEVANTIVYLSSSASSYIVGQTIVIDGGLVMR
ncbi:SDR family oxidoreductase [Mixta intestinalis]|jgi:3-oxoacyl-[acyl-carrier protein] reductase|uniref:3-oxoacyl-[acyl-carrier-protein] reductase FabG n=1 Tax=Mixta intestinalis TaxID=1615494 RepID=A0A6P1PW24_9GAMM|nr:SDR family NAD(P)-dependent oxidoreductase [Mixta intestinalis]QHM70553.1 3-oxoacyl-[acyl-carrier-protein] reductase [Mixta intestinalis]